MNIIREGAYLNILLGVGTLSLGLMYAVNSAMFAEMPINIQMFLIWFSVGVLFILTGAVALFEGAQTIMEGMRRKQEDEMQ
jgi:hypothetical protein